MHDIYLKVGRSEGLRLVKGALNDEDGSELNERKHG